MGGQPVRHALLADGEPARARAHLIEGAALFQATGNMVYMAWCLEGLAGVAAAEGDLGRAAEIAGGREALRAQTGVLLPPVYPAAWHQMLATVRDGLGEAGFDEARGRLADRPPPDIIAAAVNSRPARAVDASPAGTVDGEGPAGPRGGGPAGPEGAVLAGREGSSPAGREGAIPAGPKGGGPAGEPGAAGAR